MTPGYLVAPLVVGFVALVGLTIVKWVWGYRLRTRVGPTRLTVLRQLQRIKQDVEKDDRARSSRR